MFYTTVITTEGNWFIARCLELGVISQGETQKEAEENLQEAVELYLEDEPKDRQLASRIKPIIKSLQIPNV